MTTQGHFDSVSGEKRVETYFSWCDDGVTILCEKFECRQSAPPPMRGAVFYNEVVPGYYLTVEVLAKAMQAHLATHKKENQ